MGRILAVDDEIDLQTPIQQKFRREIRERCYGQVRESFKCERVGRISLRNKANPVTIYQVRE